MTFKEIQPKDLQDNVFTLIGKDWLGGCGEMDGRANAMTASWGGMGVLWGKPVVFIFIRPQRYTKEFVDGAEGFTLSVLDDSKRKVLNYLGAMRTRSPRRGLRRFRMEDSPASRRRERRFSAASFMRRR